MNTSRLLSLFVVLCSSTLIFPGCDVGEADSTGPQPVTVEMKIQSGSQDKFKSNNTSNVQSVDSLTEIKLLVEELELESAVDEDSLDFEAEDMVVNLPMDGSEFELTSKTVPEGLYEEFELEIENDDGGDSVNDPDFQEGTGIVVKGIYNGENFTYSSEEDFEIELELNPPLEVTENSSSLAVNINIDPSGWFVNPENGQSLDPNDPENHSIINDNIENSFDAESETEDEDEDDDDDD